VKFTSQGKEKDKQLRALAALVAAKEEALAQGNRVLQGEKTKWYVLVCMYTRVCSCVLQGEKTKWYVRVCMCTRVCSCVLQGERTKR
jgi:hypothetical protein